MRALTLTRPWPYAILHGKGIENRGWKPWPEVIGEFIALHAGAGWDAEDAAFIAETLGLTLLPDESQAQGIVGRVRVTGCLEFGKDAAPPGQERWFFNTAKPGKKSYGWPLADIEALPTPIPCRGMQGLWAVPDAVLAQLPVGWR